MTGQSVFVKHAVTDGDARSAQGLEAGIAEAVTDGDARSAQGLEAGIAEKYPTWKVQRQSDTTHLSAGQFRHSMKTHFT